MKNKLLTLAFSAVLAGCGSSVSDNGWKTDDLQQIPALIDTNLVYVSPEDGTLFEHDCCYSAGIYHNGLAQVIGSDNKGIRFIDKKGKPISEEAYKGATIFDDGIAWAVNPGSAPFAIDKKGQVIFEFTQAEWVMAFHNGLSVWIDANNRWGVVDKNGKVVIEPREGKPGPMFVNGLLPFYDKTAGGWGAVDMKGETVIECRFDEIATTDEKIFDTNYVQALREGRIPVKLGNKWGIVDRKGRIIINPQFDRLLLDGKEYLFRKGDAWGWCDAKGHYKINPQYDDTLPFGSGELAAVEDENGKWGYIDRRGAWIIQPQYRKAGKFTATDVAPVCDFRSREWGFIDKTGTWTVNPQFRQIYDIGLDNRFLVQDSSRQFGIIDSHGHYILEPICDDFSSLLLGNVHGFGGPVFVQSDYVDIEQIVALIESKLVTLKSSTADALIRNYGLKESNFPKGGGGVTVYRRDETPEVNIRIEASGVNAWSRVSDGWFGYNYVFNPSTAIDNYLISVKFSGRTERFMERISDALKQKYDYDPQTRTLAIPGYESVKQEWISGKLCFRIKTSVN